MAKTRDGLKLENILRAVSKLPDFSYRKGTGHAYVAKFPGESRMPLAESTHVKYMVLNKLSKAYDIPSNILYNTLKRGKWSEENYNLYLKK